VGHGGDSHENMDPMMGTDGHGGPATWHGGGGSDEQPSPSKYQHAVRRARQGTVKKMGTRGTYS
jgi:hypothetical protein